MITQDDIIELAQDVGFKKRNNSPVEWWMLEENILQFYQAAFKAGIAAASNVAENWNHGYDLTAKEISAKIKELAKTVHYE